MTTDARRTTILSTLWIVAMLNYLYADVIGLMDPSILRQYLTGTVGSLAITPGMLLGGAVLMETAIAMVLLARVLPYRTNRWANIAAGVLHTVAVASSLMVGSVAIYYAFFATVEIACTLVIVTYAWRWRPASPATSAPGVDAERTTGSAAPRDPASGARGRGATTGVDRARAIPRA